MHKKAYISERHNPHGGDPRFGQKRLEYWSRFFRSDHALLLEAVQKLSSQSGRELRILAAADSWDVSVPASNCRLQKEHQTLDQLLKETTFYPVLLPFLNEPYHFIHTSGLTQSLSAEAKDELILHLAEELIQICYPTLVLELNVARLSGKLNGGTPEERYEFFIHKILPDPAFFQALSDEYPVLFRMLESKSENWMNFLKETLLHFTSDHSALEALFTKEKKLGVLKRLELGHGDTHQKGKTVAIAEFSSGLKIVYKPRPFGIDEKFRALLDWFNSKAAPRHQLLTPKVLNKESYGYAEFILHRSCSTENEIGHFYGRLGAQLAVLYCLNAVDFHHENIIAAGDQPVLIDLESLFHLYIGNSSESLSAEEKAVSILNRSVQSTGILPAPIYYRDNPRAKGMDVSGMSGRDDQQSPYKVSKIIGRKTDEMRIGKDYVTISAEKNRPFLNGKPVEVYPYVHCFEEGFSQTYHLLMEHREELQEQLMLFAAIPVRRILRPTAVYGELLRNSMHPDFLRDGLDRDIFLHRVWLDTKVRAELIQTSASEKEDLLNGDIPYFLARPGDCDLSDSCGRTIPDFFEKSPLNHVLDKVSSLSEEDLAQQMKVIHLSILASDASEMADAIDLNPFQKEIRAIHGLQFQEESERIGRYLIRTAVEGDGGKDCTWISTVLEGDSELAWRISPVGPDFYNGNPGIALYLGYLWKVTGKTVYKEAAMRTIQPVLDRMALWHEHPEWSVGAYSGNGGSLYAVHELSVLFSDSMLEQAWKNALQPYISMIPNDRLYDFIGGAAGAFAVLFSIYEQSGDPKALEGAESCIRHLQEHVIRVPEGFGWRSPFDDHLLTGFSHGVSGIIASMARWHAFSKDSSVTEYIEKGLAYERNFYSESERNWVTPGRGTTSNAWCHGAPGILLSRLILMESGFGSPQVQEDIRAALSTTIEKGFGNNRSFCHGDFGQLEILRYAEKILKQPSIGRIISQIEMQLLSHMKEKPWNKGLTRGMENTGLLIGIAGVGYGLLQSFAPNLLPSLLQLRSLSVNSLENRLTRGGEKHV